MPPALPAPLPTLTNAAAADPPAADPAPIAAPASPAAAAAADATRWCCHRCHLSCCPLPPATDCHHLPAAACHRRLPSPACCHHQSVLPLSSATAAPCCRLPLPAAATCLLPPTALACARRLLPAGIRGRLPASASCRRLLPQPGSTGPSYLTPRMHANADCLPPPLPAPPAYRCHLPIATAAVCLMLLSAACLPPPTACPRRLLCPGTTRGPCLLWPACQALLTAACTCYLLPAASACLPLAPGTGCPHCRPPLQPPSSCHLPPPPASAVCRRFLPLPPDTAVAASCCRLPAVCRLLPACSPSCLRPTASCRPCLHRRPLPHTDAHYPGTYRCRHPLLIRLLPLLPGASAAAER
ncbi:keratin-associated protein 10-12-like [Mirounga leonina]|uniref:keratin-associated protein 10-12-like n=1 Tax=Mirounga leonina TaxID=9715 RepID=UPI00156C4FE1|nr:keratin-associated protein 10-12-like [Mirounga leonina]